jgi:magnesium chelatase family protein
LARQGCANSALVGKPLDEHCRLTPVASKFLESAAARLGWSGRGFHRVLRIGRSVADLAASESIDVPHLAEAIQYRRATAAS